MALTVLFTVAVFLFEHFLNKRQASAYKTTEFPKQLLETVSKIDSEKKGENDKNDSKSTKMDKVDRDKPILPQLEDKFSASQEYGTDKIQFQMISSGYNLVEEISFLLLGFLPWIWDISVNVGEMYFGVNESDNEIKITLIFLGISTIIGTITSMPFEVSSNNPNFLKMSIFHLDTKILFLNKLKNCFFPI